MNISVSYFMIINFKIFTDTFLEYNPPFNCFRKSFSSWESDSDSGLELLKYLKSAGLRLPRKNCDFLVQV